MGMRSPSSMSAGTLGRAQGPRSSTPTEPERPCAICRRGGTPMKCGGIAMNIYEPCLKIGDEVPLCIM